MRKLAPSAIVIAAFSVSQAVTPIKIWHPDEECNTFPTLHKSQNDESQEIVQQYMYNWLYYDKSEYQHLIAPGTFQTEGMFTENYRDAEFIYWGFAQTVISMSLSGKTGSDQSKSELVGVFKYNLNRWYSWTFLPASTRENSYIKTTTVLKDPGVTEYIVFVGNNVGFYQHFLIDHLGYIAYLRKNMTPTQRLLIPDNMAGMAHHILSELDPDFTQRIIFMTCRSLHDCNHKVMLDHPTATLKVLTPKSTARHANLLQLAREWVLEMHPPNPLDPKTIIYYTRNAYKHRPQRDVLLSQEYSRSMDPEQERLILNLLSHYMERFNRSEKLVVFDGSLDFLDQLKLFQSASMVIGAHGGGLANLLFTSPAIQTCDERTRVLEFTTNSLTPDLQGGSSFVSFYNLYSKCAWVDFHNLCYIPPSTHTTTFIDMDELREALLQMFHMDQDLQKFDRVRRNRPTALKVFRENRL